jgi:hypothetical protein
VSDSDSQRATNIDFKKIKPRRNEEHGERKKGQSLKRLSGVSPLRALRALRGEILFLDFYSCFTKRDEKRRSEEGCLRCEDKSENPSVSDRVASISGGASDSQLSL